MFLIVHQRNDIEVTELLTLKIFSFCALFSSFLLCFIFSFFLFYSLRDIGPEPMNAKQLNVD